METGTVTTHFGKYENLGRLGAGGMAEVYRGIDRKGIGLEVAIKTLKKDASEDLRRYFRGEALAGRMAHQNIVTVYDVGEQDGNPYIVMELIPGESLKQIMTSRRPLSLLEKLDIIRQVCVGLAFAHQNKVIHRDIKPSNIMVQPDGNVKIVDFGIARIADMSGNTVPGAVIGTIEYIAPERLKGDSWDQRVDIWSTGIMLYELLAGKVPFPCKNNDFQPFFNLVFNEPYEPIANFLSEYPPELESVVARSLAKDPDERYETAEEMADEIEAITDVLKRARIGEELARVNQLIEMEQFNEARSVLVGLRRLNPQNADIKKLLSAVDKKVEGQKKSERILEFLGLAEEAVFQEHFEDALGYYRKAASIDAAHPGLAEKIEHVTALKKKADDVEQLRRQAMEARVAKDFKKADELLAKALALKPNDTELRSELARVVDEARRVAREGERQKLIRSGREYLTLRQLPEAIAVFASALEIDPTDVEIQRIHQDAQQRLEAMQRRQITDQIVAQAQESILRRDYERALSITHRALEHFPGESVFLQLRDEATQKLHEQNARKLVEETSLAVQRLFQADPREALAVVQRALVQMPDEPTLIALEERVVEKLKIDDIEGLRAGNLKRAQAAIDARQYDQAIQILETAAIDCGESPDITYLLGVARDLKRKEQSRQIVANALKEAQALIGSGELEAAIELLKPVAADTRDASIERLLRDTANNLAQVAQRIDAAYNRVFALSEQDPEQALQLYRSLPQAIQQHSRFRDLVPKLDTTRERDRLTLEAIRSADESLQKHELSSALDSLQSVQRAYGDTPRLTSAIAEVKRRRTHLANELLTASINSARQAILQKDGSRALDDLSRTANALQYADPNIQADWNRLAQDAAEYADQRKLNTGTTSIVVKRRGLSLPIVAAIAIAVLAIVAIAYWKLKPPPPIQFGVLQINASPWAEVISITSDKNQPVKLPEGHNWTPLRLEDIPIGTYSVTVEGPNGVRKTSNNCTSNPSGDPCNIVVTPVTQSQIDEIIGGAK